MKSAMDKLIKKYFIVSIISFFMVLVITGTASYALFQIDKENTTNQNISVGNLSASLTSIEGAVVLKDLYPELSTNLPEDYKTYNFTVSNGGDYDLKYEIYLKDATSELLSKENEYSSYKQINPEYYKYINFVLDDGEVQNLSYIMENGKFMLFKGKMEPGYSKEHKIKFFIDDGETTSEGAPNDMQNSLLALDIYLDAGVYDKNFAQPLLNELLFKSNNKNVTDYNSGIKGEMFAFTHPEAEQTTGWSEEERTDYRYIGNVPNNYIQFNDEIWRIMGVFTVEGLNGEKEQRIKIVRNEQLANVAWNISGTNEWVGSTLYTLLNSGDYYNRLGSYVENGLNEKSKEQIVSTKWYLGGANTFQGLGGPDYYSFERGNVTMENRNKNIMQKVGLIYPSDYSYIYANGVNNECFDLTVSCISNNEDTSLNWFFKNSVDWTLSPLASEEDRVFIILAGAVGPNNVAFVRNMRPSVYLRSDINFKSGDGASPETAYVLE